jgi:hypothetical protein
MSCIYNKVSLCSLRMKRWRPIPGYSHCHFPPSGTKGSRLKLAAMQPYFFPYLGQFDLLNRTDVWIGYDAAQYIRHGWVNRNRVLHPVSGWQYVTVPVKKHPLATPIRQVEIARSGWRAEIFKRLDHYHMEAPLYNEVIQFLEDGLPRNEMSLSRLNIHLFRLIARRLGIGTPIHVFSELGLEMEPARGPEMLALSLCRAVKADEYINPPGGTDLYSPEKFAEQGIKLTIQSFMPITYPCGRFMFIPNLSIIDVMMWNSPEEIKKYLDTWCPGMSGEVVHE